MDALEGPARLLLSRSPGLQAVLAALLMPLLAHFL